MTDAADNTLAEIIHEALTTDSKRLNDLTLGDALRIPAIANLILSLTHPDRPLVADKDELYVASDMAAGRALAIAARLANEAPLRRAANVIRLGDTQTLDHATAQLHVDLAGIGALVVAEFILEHRQANIQANDAMPIDQRE